MAAAENRRRSKRKGLGDRSAWGSLFTKGDREKQPDLTQGTFFSRHEEPDDEETEGRRAMLREIWKRFNFWAFIATALFVIFMLFLGSVVIRMWTPQSMRDIAGYADKGRAKDLSTLLANSRGGEIVITEGEINRYLRDTCRMRQTGIFSIIAHAQGVAVRIHDGYAELIIDRLLGANIHQTTAVHLSFTQEVKQGHPLLHVHFQGGEPLMGGTPRGGSIGCRAVPEHHFQMLKPALTTPAACYPDVTRAFRERGYRPIFVGGGPGAEGYVRLVPHDTEN